MSRDFNKILEFAKNYKESKVFEALVDKWDSVIKEEKEDFDKGNIILKINFYSQIKNKLFDIFYTHNYGLMNDPSDLINWFKNFVTNEGFDEFINIMFWLMNDPKATDTKHPNFLAFRDAIDNKKPVEYTNIKTRLEYLHYGLKKQELVYIYLMSDHEDFFCSTSSYVFDSLAQFYIFLKSEYSFDLDMFMNLLILIGLIYDDDEGSNNIIDYINNLGEV